MPGFEAHFRTRSFIHRRRRRTVRAPNGQQRRQSQRISVDRCQSGCPASEIWSRAFAAGRHLLHQVNCMRALRSALQVSMALKLGTVQKNVVPYFDCLFEKKISTLIGITTFHPLRVQTLTHVYGIARARAHVGRRRRRRNALGRSVDALGTQGPRQHSLQKVRYRKEDD